MKRPSEARSSKWPIPTWTHDQNQQSQSKARALLLHVPPLKSNGLVAASGNDSY